MSKIVRNTTGGAITVSDVGVTIPALTDYTIPPQDYLLWSASSDVVGYVGLSQLVINDGSVDLTISRGIDLIKGIYPNPYTIAEPVIYNLSMPTLNTEYNYTFPVGMRKFELKARGLSAVQLAFLAGQSSTNYITMSSGTYLEETNISQTSPITIYVQANRSSETLEITYWT